MTAILLLIFAAKCVSSLLSTLTLYAAIYATALRFVSTAALSDSIKLGVISSVAVQAASGNWWGIGAAVAGGVLGNAIAYAMRQRMAKP